MLGSLVVHSYKYMRPMINESNHWSLVSYIYKNTLLESPTQGFLVVYFLNFFFFHFFNFLFISYSKVFTIFIAYYDILGSTKWEKREQWRWEPTPSGDMLFRTTIEMWFQCNSCNVWTNTFLMGKVFGWVVLPYNAKIDANPLGWALNVSWCLWHGISKISQHLFCSHNHNCIGNSW